MNNMNNTSKHTVYLVYYPTLKKNKRFKVGETTINLKHRLTVLKNDVHHKPELLGSFEIQLTKSEALFVESYIRLNFEKQFELYSMDHFKYDDKLLKEDIAGELLEIFYNSYNEAIEIIKNVYRKVK